jgi:hypothetical protein
VASGGKPLGGSLLASTGMFLVFGATREAAWEHVINFCCQSRSHVAPKFLLFTLVLLNQTALVGLGHVLAALAANFMNGPENHLLRSAVARAAVSREVANVSASNIGRAVDRESHAVRDLTLPTLCVEARLVPGTFTGVDMNPSSLMFRVHFGPNVVFGVPDPTDSSSDRATEHAEAIGPFAYPASSRLQQLPHIGVARESFVGGTAIIGATV